MRQLAELQLFERVCNSEQPYAETGHKDKGFKRETNDFL